MTASDLGSGRTDESQVASGVMTPSFLGWLAWFRLHFTCSSSRFWACMQLERICHAQGGLMEGETVDSSPVVEHVADLSTLRMKTWKHIFVEVDREAPAPLIFRSVERTRASAFWSMPSKRAASFEESPERATAL